MATSRDGRLLSSGARPTGPKVPDARTDIASSAMQITDNPLGRTCARSTVPAPMFGLDLSGKLAQNVPLRTPRPNDRLPGPEVRA
jgi:hypothetical protein